MTDEEVLRIATGLTQDEWGEMWWAMRAYQYYDQRYDSLICKDIALLEDKRVYITSLGLRVWEWRDLFNVG
jgi:hypothetical protein